MAEKRVTRSKRLALDATGKDVSDLTEAITFIYQYLEPDPAGGEEPIVVDEVRFEPNTDDVMTRALSGFGFHTHCGNWINKAVNTDGLSGEDVKDRLAEYKQMLDEGGWTNRKGEATAGAAIFVLAFARVRAAAEGGDVDEYHERVKAAWETWDEATKESIRKDEEVKAEVLTIRLERQKARAAKAKEAGGEKVALPQF
jgi:hypothetical protein